MTNRPLVTCRHWPLLAHVAAASSELSTRPQSQGATKHKTCCKTRGMPANGQASLLNSLMTSASRNHRTASQKRQLLQRHQMLSVSEEPSNLTLTTMRPFPLIGHRLTTLANQGHLPENSRRKWQYPLGRPEFPREPC
jgi:hypothetical protein